MPETRSVIDIMYDYATIHGCDSEPFSQMAVISSSLIGPNGLGNQGICYGLSVAWLEAIKNGKEAGFLDANRNWTTSPAFARSHLIWKNQDSTDTWQKLVGLKPALDHDDFEKEHDFSITGQGMLEFAHWLRGGIGTRYFLISVKGHSMAAAGSGVGRLKFFDPNGGVVSTMFAANLARFLEAFLNNEKMRAHYFPYKGGNRIEVRKFKKG